MIAFAALTLSACSLIEDVATIKINVRDFTINIPVTLASPDRITRSEPFNFNGSYEVSLNDAHFGKLKNYINLISDIKIKEVTINIINPSEVEVRNLTFSATGVTLNFSIASHNFGQEPYHGNTRLKTFIKNVILQLQNGNVTVNVAGTINLASDTINLISNANTSVEIEISGVQAWAKTIEF